MKALKYGLLAGGLALLPQASNAQTSAQECRDEVAEALNVNGNNVDVSQGGSGDNGFAVIRWEANLSGRRIQGFCETNRAGRVISAQLGRNRGGGFNKGNNNGNNNANNNNNNNNNNGGFPKGGNNNGGAFPKGGGNNNNGVAVIPVNVDTSGRGTFTGMGQAVRITRGWVDTRTTPSVSLSGDGDFKITLTGNVTGSGQDREFTMRITNSNRGNASGTATIRLNPQRDEVESIRYEGRVGNSNVNGTFNRDN